MFDTEFSAGIKAVKLSAKGKHGMVVRRIRLTLVREFDEAIATGLGAEGKAACEFLKSSGFARVTIPLDAITARLALTLPQGAFEIAVAQGVRAVASAGKKKPAPKEDGDYAFGGPRKRRRKAPRPERVDAGPEVLIDFEFAFTSDAVAFLAQHLGSHGKVLLSRAQLSLPGTAKKPAVKAPAAPKPTTLAGAPEEPGNVIPICAELDAACDALDPQTAATPDEAEEMRAAQLDADKAEATGEDTRPEWSRAPLLATPAPDTAGDRARRKRRNRIEDEKGQELVQPAPATTAGCVCDKLPAPERPCIVCVAAMDGGDEAPASADAEGAVS